jgi:hypothetical protein
VPQARISAYLVSSAMITKVMRGSRPTSLAESGPASLRRCRWEATSVSRMTGFMTDRQARSRCRSGVGEGQEVVEFLVRLERVGSQVVEGADWLRVLGGRQLRDGQLRPSRHADLPACRTFARPSST